MASKDIIPIQVHRQTENLGQKAAQSLTSSATLEKSFNLSKGQSPHLQNGTYIYLSHTLNVRILGERCYIN